MKDVSILVLMDLARELFWRVGVSGERNVSILVLMDLARESEAAVFGSWLCKVSILVLMDLARELQTNTRQNRVYICFNPCFNGSCSRIL